MEKRNRIVVEGPDCMGKSTLVQQLLTKLDGWSHFHTGGPKTDEQLDQMCLAVETHQAGVGTVFDRVPHISEIAYRPITRNGVTVSADLQQDLIDRLAATRPIVIVCRRRELPEVEGEERPHKSVEYWAKVIAGYGGIVERYDALVPVLANRSIPVYCYDWTLEGDWENLQEWLDFFLHPEAEG